MSGVRGRRLVGIAVVATMVMSCAAFAGDRKLFVVKIKNTGRLAFRPGASLVVRGSGGRVSRMAMKQVAGGKQSKRRDRGSVEPGGIGVYHLEVDTHFNTVTGVHVDEWLGPRSWDFDYRGAGPYSVDFDKPHKQRR